MCTNSWPNYSAWLQTAWGAGAEFWSSFPQQAIAGASNLVFGINPPYYLDDFKAMYPKFFGTPTALSGCGTTQGSAVVTVPSTQGLMWGQFAQSWGVLGPGSVILSTQGATQVTLNTPALTTNANATIQVYTQQPVPLGVIKTYLNLANASLVQARWQESWQVGVSLYIAHFLTLYAKSDSSEVLTLLQDAVHGEVPVGAVPGTVYTLSAQPPGGALQALTVNGLFQIPGVAYTLVGNTITFAAPTSGGATLYATWPVQQEVFSSVPATGASIAAQGLAGGIQTSKSVGDVSVSYQPLDSLKGWGAWNLTSYGQQLATMAAVVGAGPMVIY